MNRILDNKVLSNIKLMQWYQLSEKLPGNYRESFRNLIDSVKDKILDFSDGKDIAVPLLLAMMVELKGEIDNLEDKIELANIRSYRRSF